MKPRHNVIFSSLLLLSTINVCRADIDCNLTANTIDPVMGPISGYPWAKFRACFNALPFNSFLRDDILDNLVKYNNALNADQDLMADSGPPFNVHFRMSDVATQLKQQNFSSTFEFLKALSKSVDGNTLDEHTSFYMPACFAAAQFVDVNIVPQAQGNNIIFMTREPESFKKSAYFAAYGLNHSNLWGLQVLAINGLSPEMYLNKLVSGDYFRFKDPNLVVDDMLFQGMLYHRPRRDQEDPADAINLTLASNKGQPITVSLPYAGFSNAPEAQASNLTELAGNCLNLPLPANAPPFLPGAQVVQKSLTFQQLRANLGNLRPTLERPISIEDEPFLKTREIGYTTHDPANIGKKKVYNPHYKYQWYNENKSGTLTLIDIFSNAPLTYSLYKNAKGTTAIFRLDAFELNDGNDSEANFNDLKAFLDQNLTRAALEADQLVWDFSYNPGGDAALMAELRRYLSGLNPEHIIYRHTDYFDPLFATLIGLPAFSIDDIGVNLYVKGAVSKPDNSMYPDFDWYLPGVIKTFRPNVNQLWSLDTIDPGPIPLTPSTYAANALTHFTSANKAFVLVGACFSACTHTVRAMTSDGGFIAVGIGGSLNLKDPKYAGEPSGTGTIHSIYDFPFYVEFFADILGVNFPDSVHVGIPYLAVTNANFPQFETLLSDNQTLTNYAADVPLVKCRAPTWDIGNNGNRTNVYDAALNTINKGICKNRGN